ncbi:MAG: hypothetical protein J0G28_14450 [Afipia sp.]|nr:hypothetical protein [Afipia sp.]
MTGRTWSSSETARLMEEVRRARSEHRKISGRQWKKIARGFPDRTTRALQARIELMLSRERAGAPVALPVRVVGEHSTITAAIFGDPLPGRSALDRRDAAAP